MNTNRLKKIAVLGCVVSSLLVTIYGAHAASFKEVEVQALYIYKILQLVKWNDVDKTKVVMCSTEDSDDDTVGNAFMKIISNDADDKAKFSSKLLGLRGEYDRCDIVFIDKKVVNLDEILFKISNKDIITISDMKGFSRKGGMFEFYINDDGKIKVELNYENLKKADLNVSGRLLEVIKIVK